MIERIELLVHAGAPSGRNDDEKYKAQAAAYLNFQGGRTNKVRGSSPEPPSSIHQAPGHTGESHDATARDESPTEFLDDTQLAITGLDSQLFTSSLLLTRNEVPNRCIGRRSSMPKAVMCSDPSNPWGDSSGSHEITLAHVRSFGKRKHTDDDKHAAHGALPDKVVTGNDTMSRGSRARSRVSSEAPSSSSYLDTPVLDRSVKKRRMKEKPADPAAVISPYRALSDGYQTGLAFVGALSAPSVLPATAPAAVARSQNSPGVSEPPTSELPTSYSLSDITSASSRARFGISQRSAKAPQAMGEGESSPPGKVDASTVSSSTDGRAVGRHEGTPALGSRPSANPGVEKQAIVVADDTQGEMGNTVVAANAIASWASKKAATVTITEAPPLPAQKKFATSDIPPEDAPAARSDILQSLHRLSTSIYPPEPATSIETFKTFLTEGLAALSSNSATSDRYRPISIARNLHPQERGYWLLDPSTWSLETQLVFWEFMERAISSGSPGWGVWCTREDDSQKNIRTKGEEEVHGLGLIRIYCWGQVVREIWLLLYVASRSQARKVGMSWVDAEGKVVVQMNRG